MNYFLNLPCSSFHKIFRQVFSELFFNCECLTFVFLKKQMGCYLGLIFSLIFNKLIQTVCFNLRRSPQQSFFIKYFLIRSLYPNYFLNYACSSLIKSSDKSFLNYFFNCVCLTFVFLKKQVGCCFGLIFSLIFNKLIQTVRFNLRRSPQQSFFSSTF